MRQTSITYGLLAAVSCWVMLLSLLSPASNSVQTATSPASDGSRCVIKFVDKSRFANSATPGQVTLRMDILDGAGKPIVNLKDSDFTVIEEDLPGRVTAFRGPQSLAMNLALVIDVSGSMHADHRIEGAKQSAIAVVDALKDDRDRLAIIPFSSTSKLLRPLEVLTSTNRQACRDLISGLRPGGGTRIGPPTIEALNLYKSHSIDGVKMVMVMTDGEDQGFASHIDTIAQLSEEVGAQVHTIGFGGDVGARSAATLEEVARRCSGQYQHAPTNEELTRIFNARVQESVNECTLTYDSPYPQPDGLPRKVELKVKAPHGSLSAGFSYQVGPILGARSTPASWAIEKGTTAPTGGPISFVFPIILFVILFAALAAGLVTTEFSMTALRGMATTIGGTTSNAVPSAQTIPPATQPIRSPVPLPPPPTKSTQAVNAGPAPLANSSNAPLPKPPAVNSASSIPAPCPVPSVPPAPVKPAIKLPPPPKPK